MTSNDPVIAKKLARLMRASRKRNAFTQQAVAARLGISQGALSKMENGFLIPSAPQWFEFCEMTRISADSLTMGYIDGSTPAILQSPDDVRFKMPKSYAHLRGSKARAMLPFLNYFKNVMGEDRLAEYFRHIKMDPDFFAELDNQISIDFCLDISRHLIRQGHLTMDRGGTLKQAVTDPHAHGRLHRDYEGISTATNLLSVLLLNSKQYECNFSYAMEEQTAHEVVISVKPEAHMKEFSYKDDPVLGDFLCRYKKFYFQSFAGYSGSAKTTLTEVDCHYKGAERCIYKIQPAV